MSRVTIVTDLGFGDAGKGSLVDYLARAEAATLVVRHNGGAQAAHNVITPDGRHHTFSQFGSASFVAGTETHLSRFMLVNPLGLTTEARALAALGVPNLNRRLTIDERAMIITPYHQAANRLRELARGQGRHGSCGQGIGEAMADSIETPSATIYAGDLTSLHTVRALLERQRQLKLSQFAGIMQQLASDPLAAPELATLLDSSLPETVAAFYGAFVSQFRIVGKNFLTVQMNRHEHTIFEGAQGVLLDEWYGFHPYTTWSTTTHANALSLLAEANFEGDVTRLGLIRGYTTRHGAGPFVTESAQLTQFRRDYHNGTGVWQEGFRVGHFDAVATRYALDVVGGVDGLVISNLDRLDGPDSPKIATSYTYNARGNRPVAFGKTGPVLAITRAPAPDLDYQLAITSGLAHCVPNYEVPTSGLYNRRSDPAYTQRIGELLGTPVRLISTGPTATGKMVV